MDMIAKLLNKLADRGLILPNTSTRGDGSGYTKIQKNGTIELMNEAVVWDDINIGGVTLTRAAGNQPDLIKIDTTDIITYAFDGGASAEELHGSFELQHNYKEGTDLKPHAHFYPAATGTGDFKIFLDYWIVGGESEFTTISGTLNYVATVGDAWDSVFITFSDIDGESLKIGAQIHFRIYRDPTDAADTYTGDVAIGTFGVHYQINTLGSRQVFIK